MLQFLSQSIRELSRQDYENLFGKLSPTQQAEILARKGPDAQERSLLARKLCAELAGCEMRQIQKRPSGQPFLADSPLFVSLSHSADRAFCAVSDVPVGADVERIRPVRRRLFDRVFSERERAGWPPLEAAPGEMVYDEEWLRRFFAGWTAKEAYFKAVGTGITDFHAVCPADLAGEFRTFFENGYCYSLFRPENSKKAPPPSERDVGAAD